MSNVTPLLLCSMRHLSISHLPASLPLFQVLSAFQAQQNAAAAQPQLLIPLSSIPSYSAAMDSNPLLGSTYKKFPYPSMAEISSLAAQTQFTEEQIKVDERVSQISPLIKDVVFSPISVSQLEASY